MKQLCLSIGSRIIRAVCGCLLLLLWLSCCAGAMEPPAQAKGTPPPAQSDWKSVEQAMGKTGTMQPGNVYTFRFPRTDLSVTVGQVPVKAGLALGSHIEFLPMGNRAMMMGDLVLTEDEVNPVLLTLQQRGVQQAALHNHLLHESPRVMYLHLAGQGNPVTLAQGVRAALEQTRTPLTPSPSSSQPPPLDLDTGRLDTILHAHGKATNGIYQYSIARAEKIHDGGMELPPAMGVATAISFQPLGAAKAAITGDFPLAAQEVNPVIKALRTHGIEVTALHSHSLTETPRLFYLHFWAHDDAIHLAQGLRAALDQTKSASARPR